MCHFLSTLTLLYSLHLHSCATISVCSFFTGLDPVTSPSLGSKYFAIKSLNWHTSFPEALISHASSKTNRIHCIPWVPSCSSTLSTSAQGRQGGTSSRTMTQGPGDPYLVRNHFQFLYLDWDDHRVNLHKKWSRVLTLITSMEELRHGIDKLARGKLALIIIASFQQVH